MQATETEVVTVERRHSRGNGTITVRGNDEAAVRDAARRVFDTLHDQWRQPTMPVVSRDGDEWSARVSFWGCE